MTLNAQPPNWRFRPWNPLAANDPTVQLARALRDGIEQLEQGRADTAVEHLTVVVEDHDLRGASDMQDILAKATSLLAQALLKQGDLPAARRRCSDALDLCRRIEDDVGIANVRALSSEIEDAQRAQEDEERRQRSMQMLSRTDTDTLRATYAKDPLSLAEILLKKSSAELEAGRTKSARTLAGEVLTRATAESWRRQEVLARLTLARIDPHDAPTQLTRAWERAERDSDHTLVATVARAAELSGVTLSSMSGPEMPGKPHDT
jgi:hypothetical protein